MTNEEKAKAYDEALKRAKEWITEREQLICPREIVESIFPQLRESEDETTRKELLNFVRSFWADHKEKLPQSSRWVTYLEKQKERNDEDEECTDFTIYHPLKNGEGKYECIPYSFYGSLTSFSEDKDLIDFLRTCFYTKEECNEWIEQQKEQKPEEKPVNWTELTWEDINELEDIINKVHYEFRNGIGQESFGKEVLEQFREYKGDEYLDEEQKPTDLLDTMLSKDPHLPKQAVKYEQKPAEWSKEDEEMYARVVRRYTDYEGVIMRTKEESVANKMLDAMAQEEIWLKSLRPDTFQNGNSRPKASDNWKPSYEQMEAFRRYIEDFQARAKAAVGGWNNFDVMIRLYEQLKKL